MTGRAEKKLTAMQHVQDVALGLFEQRGFDKVSVEDIAAAADSSPATVYRHFETKPGIVFWDEYDDLLVDALTNRSITTTAGVRDAVIAGLGTVYDGGSVTILRRTKLIYSEAALRGAIPERMDLLSQWIAALLSAPDPPTLQHDVVARAGTGALQSAIDHWQRHDGVRPLADLITEAFATLE